MKNYKSQCTKNEIFVICDNIRSLFNVGAIFRTSDGAGVNKIYLTGMTGYPKQDDPNWTQTLKIAKTSLGAEKSVDWEYIKNPVDIIKKLKSQNIHIYALENNLSNYQSHNFQQTAYKFPLALIVGHEVNGVSESILPLVDEFIELPMHGKKESLNVSVAFGICTYEIIKHRPQ